MLTGVQIEKVREEGINIIDKKQVKHVMNADTIVLALGAKADNKLTGELKSGTWKLYCIGDCVKPRKMIDAIYEGSYVARQI